MAQETVYKPFAIAYEAAGIQRIQAGREAQQGHTKNEAIHAQSSILNYVFGLEAFINQVLDDFATVPKSVMESVDRVPLVDKWALAPALCGIQNPRQPFDAGREPFQSFKELVDVRNSWAHPKQRRRPLRDDVQADPIIHVSEYGAYLDFWYYQNTRIPNLPTMVRAAHAETAFKVTRDMIAWIQGLMPNKVTDDWFLFVPVEEDAPAAPPAPKKGKRETKPKP